MLFDICAKNRFLKKFLAFSDFDQSWHAATPPKPIQPRNFPTDHLQIFTECVTLIREKALKTISFLIFIQDLRQGGILFAPPSQGRLMHDYSNDYCITDGEECGKRRLFL